MSPGYDYGSKHLMLREPGAGMADNNPNQTSIYKHNKETVQRPDVGVEAQFSNKKPSKTYRYDSSLAPELSWDENPDRELAEWLLKIIADAVARGDGQQFNSPETWKGTGETFRSVAQCVSRLQSLTRPFLNWTGKAERQQVTVPTLPLFVHERHSTQAILDTLKSHKAKGTNLDLFGDMDLDVADKLDAYEHKGPWTNRLILGDSLQVMNSLLEYEGMGGQVQMVYFDPPYGVKFGSNFQPFVRKNSVKHGADEEMIREPEMVKAYRDTWELGLHSYLTYLRDRLMLAREMLTDSGSIFVQISDENTHHLRELLDEVFGAENFCSCITVRKTSGMGATLLPTTQDFLLWYAKDKRVVAYNQIYTSKTDSAETDSHYQRDDDGRLYTLSDLTGQNNNVQSCVFDYEYEGRVYRLPASRQWKTTREGLDRLAAAGRIQSSGNSIRYRRYLDDFPLSPITDTWHDIGGSVQSRSDPKIYVVQTGTAPIQRAMLMTTDPGDLVLDITCGSGTTAFVAEQWGRRWITCDTSRVPIALARQRLLTSIFPWFRLKQPSLGPAGGFVYERKQNRKGEEIGGLVPRLSMKSFTKNESSDLETIVDRPEQAANVIRVCGPFTVEATIQSAMSLDELEQAPTAPNSPRSYLDRMIEILRQSKTLRLPGNVTVELETVSPLIDAEYLHAEGMSQNGSEKRIAVVFGPEDGAIGSEYVFNAHTEALQQGYQQLFLFGFAIQAKAREMLEKLKLPTTYIAVTPDVVMSDLLKTSKSSEIFSITGLPDVDVEPAGKRDDGTLLHRVVVKGLDIFRPDTMETDEIAAENLPCWMLDTNYNGMVFLASQVFFPKTSAWDNLQKSLKGQFADSVWEHLAGTVSEPFVAGDKGRIAVKAIDERGNELMVVKPIQGNA